MNRGDGPIIRFALPSKGHLHAGIIDLLRRSGYPVRRPSERQYEAAIDGHPRYHVLFMRPRDIVTQVQEGRCYLGVTGYDVFAERAEEATEALVVMPNLGYGACRLVVAVPESWVDVAHMIDLIDVAAEFKAAGRSFRVSTKYGSLTRAHLRAWGIHDFLLVDAEGALELQPSLEIADVIVDLTSSGTTLRDNRLKEIEGGTVLESAACLIGHVPSLRPLTAEGDSSALALLLDALDGVRTAAGWMQFEVMGQAAPGRSSAQAAAEVARALDQHGARHSCRGDVWTADGTEAWRVTGLIRAADLAACRGKLSMLGARRIVALPARFVYDSGETSTFAQLKRTLGLDARGDISLEL